MTISDSAREISRCLDAIVDLTRHHDSQELLTALLGTLCMSFQAQRVRLFTLSNANRDTEFNESNIQNILVKDLFDTEFGEPRPLSEDADLVSCICTQDLVSRDVPGGRRVVFPIFGAHHVRALLVIEGLSDGTISYELLAKVLQVYSNQTSMLSRTEHDPLTGLYNRQSFYERIRRVALRVPPQRRAADGPGTSGICFALFDIDHFKQINDQYGHLYGDEVLLLLARLMTHSFRHDDLLFRYGGEEFAAVLTNVDLENAERMLERFRCAVEAYAFPQIGHKTVSIGFTMVNVEQGVDKVVMCADKALYYAKNHGRNQTCCYEKLIAEGKLEPVTVAEGDIELF